METLNNNSFSALLLEWHARHGRHDLPWQKTTSSYAIWISEIMLQQTQVNTVIPYYERFMARYPDMQTLCHAPVDDVLAYWAGLGYYSRARNIHRCAGIVCQQFNGSLPDNLEALMALPGIGRSTAGAILAFSHGQRQPILDGNVRRILCRYFAIEGWHGSKGVQNRLWELADELTPEKDVASYTQAVMDLGAMVCTRNRPHCSRCPVNTTCLARQQGLTEKLPTPKPRTQVPVRETTMLLCTSPEDGILLERRPEAGIWGGLWSLPEVSPAAPEETDLIIQAADKLGLQALYWRPLTPLRHRFTHYTLDIQPLHVHVKPHADRIMEPRQVLWYTQQTFLETGRLLATPTPVRKILAGLDNNPGTPDNWNKVNNDD